MDEGFESGLSWYYLQKMTERDSTEKFDIIVESADKINGWIALSALTQTMVEGELLFNELKTHPIIVDPEGSEIGKKGESSSRSIVWGSQKLNEVQQYGMGVEPFRMWVASVDSSTPRSNTVVLEEHSLGSIGFILDTKREELNLLRKIFWQSATVLSKLEAKYDNGPLDLANRPTLFAIQAMSQYLLSAIADAYEQRNLSGVYSSIMDFAKFHFLDTMLPFLSDAAIQGDTLAGYLLANITRDLLLISSPVLPFSTEESFLHAFRTSMYSEGLYQLSTFKSGARRPDPNLISSYITMYKLKERISTILETIYKGEKRDTRKKLGLVGIYDATSSELRKSLYAIGLEDLAKVLEVDRVELKPRDYSEGGHGYKGKIYGSFKFGKIEFKIVEGKHKKGQPLEADVIV